MGGALVASLGDCVFAQIVPDTTLGSENSRVTGISPTIDQINGGATRGTNLFHSFQEFNVGEGRSAYFTNPAGIENILTRVTGANASNILGTLGVSGGNANLFLINPNGIIFGLNASLDVGGSFTATTANAIKLGDIGLFSASEPVTSNLLTVRPSALFFNATAPGTIVNQSLAQSLSGLGTGNGGTLSVTASEAVEVIGVSANRQVSSALTAQTTGAGNARDLTIATEQLTIRDGAEVNVSSTGTGIAGELRVEADAIRLDNQGKIRADTSGGGGNIYLSTDDLILRRRSSISTNARGRDITGGNITIDTDNLVAVPREDSDISANATAGIGGRVIVNAFGIFGTEFRLRPTELSDITASSQLGPQFNGVVQLNTPGIDPSRGLANLPTEVVDASNQIAQTCGAGGREARKNEFIVTGRRGMPSNPYEPLSNDEPLTDVRPPSGLRSSSNSEPVAVRTLIPKPTTSKQKPPIIEAQEWVINDKGQVVLTATASTATPHNSWLQSATCPSS